METRCEEVGEDDGEEGWSLHRPETGSVPVYAGRSTHCVGRIDDHYHVIDLEYVDEVGHKEEVWLPG